MNTTHSGIREKTCLTGAVLLLSASLLSGSEITLRAEAERDNALYRAGEKIVFRVSALDKSGKTTAGKKLDYTIRGDGAPEQSGTVLSGEKPVEITTRLDHPGFVLLTVSASEDGKIRKTWAGAGVDVLKIRAATPETPDFDAFWASQLKKMRAVNCKVERGEVTDPKIMKGVSVYDVKLRDGKWNAGGFLLLPPNPVKGAHPIIITFNGASKIGAFYHSCDRMAATYKAIVFNMNLHDTANQVTEAERKRLSKSPQIANYMYRNADDPEQYPIRDIFLRVARCLDYLKTLPEWDGKTVIARGGSLGGAQALAAAYFEEKTVLCVANAPALSDHYGMEQNQASGWPGLFAHLAAGDPEKLPAAKQSMRYFDTVNFARRLKCPVTMSVGFIDIICPPTTAYAVYNSLPGTEKSIKNVTLGQHGASLKKGEKGVFSHGGTLVRQACRKAWNSNSSDGKRIKRQAGRKAEKK